MYRYREIGFTKVAEKREHRSQGSDEIGNGTVKSALAMQRNRKVNKWKFPKIKGRKNEKSKRGKK